MTMITLAQVQAVERLLETTALGYGEIAAHVGMSMASVADIAHGRHRLSKDRRAETEARMQAKPKNSLYERLAVPEQCAGCGGMITEKPCRLCETRRIKAQDAVRQRIQRARPVRD